MQGYNVIIVYNNKLDKILMCKRKKDPYQGMSNFVGGKIEKGEKGIDAAYRELFEETAIERKHINLHHLMDYTYYYGNCYVEVYVGKLKENFEVHGEENKLYWSTLDHNFFDTKLYAGEGNIGHMIEQVNLFKNQLFKE